MKKNNEAKAVNPNEKKVDDKSLKAPNNTPDKPNPNYQDKSPNLNNLAEILMPKDSEFKNGTPDRKSLPTAKLNPRLCLPKGEKLPTNFNLKKRGEWLKP